jgi:hypothetical protein
MDVTISSYVKDSKLQLVLTFEKTLDSINFETYPIDTLIFIYISQIKQEDFSITSCYVENANLIITLTFAVSISSTVGGLTFLTT